jgi:8-oxo-dGTP pyrophosphatase MutT (NUDIX family)
LRPGEPLRKALAREIGEELGVTCEVGPYLGAVEHFWEDESRPHHEINHCFATRSCDLSPASDPESQEHLLEFGWTRTADLERVNLQPYPLRNLISRRLGGERETWWGSTLEHGRDALSD